MKPLRTYPALALAGLLTASALAQDASITVDANQVQHRISRYLTGACLEDVNHEMYGGIDSQMIFGESFAEPAPQPALQGFTAFGGHWTAEADGTLQAAGGDGPKLLGEGPGFEEGEASVDLYFEEQAPGNAGLVVKVSEAGVGADRFIGYEVALETSGTLVLGRHRHNFEPLQRVPCEVPLKQWLNLRARMSGKALEILVNGKSITRFEDTEHPLSRGLVGLRTWQREARFRNLTVTAGGARRGIPFAYVQTDAWAQGVSGMWRPLRRGTAEGEFTLDEQGPFVGTQSQGLIFKSGTGDLGIENAGLGQWGMDFVKSKPYEGYLWARAATPTKVVVSLESRDGQHVYAERAIPVTTRTWQRLDFQLKPNATDHGGRFAIKLKEPGRITVGYAFLQPGRWGRYKGLPVRRDVAEGLIQQGVTVLRLGGCMANAAEYRWKNMVGPRAERRPYAGWWHPRSSNGWGIFDFLNFCEAAGILAVPDVNLDETPQDMADFMEYVTGSPESTWGRRRVQDGHPKPYHLKYLEIGNEERVNEHYWEKFKPLAEAIWAKDPEIIIVVGDFAYHRAITDPFHFSGADGHITTLAAQQKILQLARQHDREVWFDVHVGTDGPRPDFGGTLSYIDALDKLADGARHRVVIFEFNAGNHSQRRALANAAAIQMVENDGRLPLACSANCLQPDGQNDNDWNQGLLFLNPSQVWLQPPGYVTWMVSRNYEPLLVASHVQCPGDALSVNAKRSEDGRTLVLQVVNVSEQPVRAILQVNGFVPSRSVAQVEELSGPLQAANTASAPERIKPTTRAWEHGLQKGKPSFTFAPFSFTVIRFE